MAAIGDAVGAAHGGACQRHALAVAGLGGSGGRRRRQQQQRQGQAGRQREGGARKPERHWKGLPGRGCRCAIEGGGGVLAGGFGLQGTEGRRERRLFVRHRNEVPIIVAGTFVLSSASTHAAAGPARCREGAVACGLAASLQPCKRILRRQRPSRPWDGALRSCHWWPLVLASLARYHTVSGQRTPHLAACSFVLAQPQCSVQSTSRHLRHGMLARPCSEQRWRRRGGALPPGHTWPH